MKELLKVFKDWGVELLKQKGNMIHIKVKNKHDNLPKGVIFIVSQDGENEFRMAMAQWDAVWGLFVPSYGDRDLLPNQADDGFIHLLNLEDVKRLIYRLIHYFP